MLKALTAAAFALALLVAAAPAGASDVFYTCYPELCRVKPDGSGLRHLTHDGDDTVGDSYGDISASRDGRLAFGHSGHVFLADRNAHHRKRLDDAFGRFVLHPDGEHMMWIGPATNPRWCRGTLHPFDFRCSVMFQNRRTYLAWGPHHSLLSIDADARQTVCTTRIDKDREAACKHVLVRERSPNYFFLMPSLSPDERFLATTTEFGPDDSGSIAIYDLTSGKRVKRLTRGHEDRLPVWSPDGRYIAFDRGYPDGSWAVARVSASGGKVKVLDRRKAGIYEVAWGG
jgi:dipeptidyl aminopeptidase/acylaminoacyl peptidase